MQKNNAEKARTKMQSKINAITKIHSNALQLIELHRAERDKHKHESI